MKRPFDSLYVHVPFCAAKCDYCAFYSVADSSADQRRAYIGRVPADLADSAERCVLLRSIFIGGGTPSVLTSDELDRLLCGIRKSASLAPDIEFTVECNPESLSRAKVALLACNGVNRISLGVQSLSCRLRDTLGRRTALPDLPELIASLQDEGIVNINVDLIYAIPGQTMQDWAAEIARACDLGITHLSTYALTIEEGTALGRRDTPIPDDEITADMWEAAAEVARPYGLARYEVSNLARPGAECRHNLGIWHGTTYLGLGPAAASFDGELRWTQPADLDAWLRRSHPDEDHLSSEDRAAEVLAFGLRTSRGWSVQEFRNASGFDVFALRGPQIYELVAEGTLVIDADRISPTPRGLLFADHVAERLL